MKSIKLLDCTLRDGGYVNDWNFGHSVIIGTYKRLDEAGVDYIEVGFLDDRRPFDINRSIQPNTDCFNKIFENVRKKHAIPVAMIDYGTCDISNIGSCDSTFIDGIRVIFKKEKIDEALPFCKAIKDKGYKLFIQAISITAYSDIEMLEFIQKVNEVKPYTFSIVDTYGFLDNSKLTHYFDLINNNLDKDIHIGYHGHNNFQLAFSNSIKYLSLESQRTFFVDSTVYGMGKSAGNCASELLMMHLNEKYGTHYDIDQVLEILDTYLMSVYQKQYWGYKYNFFISALQNCHPSYVEYLLNKKTLSVSAINEILSQIPDDKKLLYSESYIEEAYLKYQSNDIDDSNAIKELHNAFEGRNIVVICPGSSIRTQKNKIAEHINNSNSIIIAMNFEPADYKCDYIFVSNSKRYSTLSDNFSESTASKMILTSNITPIDRKPDFTLNYNSLINENTVRCDNALILWLSALKKMEVKKVSLAGFDGFVDGQNDYYDSRYAFGGNRDYVIQSNTTIKKCLNELSENIEITFLTESIYDDNSN